MDMGRRIVLMVKKVEAAEVVLWGRTIGAVVWDDEEQLATFEYTGAFQRSAVELAPLQMPLGPRIHRFPELSRESYQGLPGLLADSLPDRFGTLLIDQWVQRQGRTVESFSPIERLCYIGRRGMGALEFESALNLGGNFDAPGIVEIDRLVALASDALSEKLSLDTSLHDEEALNDIIRVGTSAGGARAKAVIAWNEETGEVRSGQVDAGLGFEYWLLKFDGVSNNRDTELADPQGFGLVEFAYSQMARAAGITMAPTRLLRERGRGHFMTKRFDRADDGGKVHMQTLFALAHYDFNLAGAFSYEQTLSVMRRLGLPHGDIVEQIRRAYFNVVARNQDDHTKNIAFVMDRRGVWRLSPAYDVMWAHNPQGQWTNRHQMAINSKRDDFTIEDLRHLAREGGLSPSAADDLLAEVDAAVADWPRLAATAGVAPNAIRTISESHRRLL